MKKERHTLVHVILAGIIMLLLGNITLKILHQKENFIPKVKTHISTVLQIDTADINVDANIMNELGADEIEFIEIISNIEDDLKVIKFPDSCEEYNTTRKIADYISRNK